MAREQRLGLILSTEEKKLLINLAKRVGGLSLAAYIRLLIYQAAIQARLDGQEITTYPGNEKTP